MFAHHGGHVLFGPQVDRAKRLALALQALHFDIQRLGIGHEVGVHSQALQQFRRGAFGLFRDAGGGIGDGFAGGLIAGLGAGAGLTGLAVQAVSLTLGQLRVTQGGFSLGQRIGCTLAAGLGLGDRVRQFLALGGDLLGGGVGLVQLFFGLGAASGKFGAALFCRLKPVPPA